MFYSYPQAANSLELRIYLSIIYDICWQPFPVEVIVTFFRHPVCTCQMNHSSLWDMIYQVLALVEEFASQNMHAINSIQLNIQVDFHIGTEEADWGGSMFCTWYNEELRMYAHRCNFAQHLLSL